MLSFLQSQLGRRSSNTPLTAARADSTRSSRTDSVLNASTSSSQAPSLTPATSNADTASLSTDATPKQENLSQNSKRLRPSRTSNNTCNGRTFAGSAKRKSRRTTAGDASGIASDETAAESNGGAEEQLLQKSGRALNHDWEQETLPGAGSVLLMKEENLKKRRRSTRLDMPEKTSDMSEKTSSVLGKRTRKIVEVGMEELKNLKGNKRAGLRSRDVEALNHENPKTKKARYSEPSAEDQMPRLEAENNVVKRPCKRWLSQGLYVGQDRDFDARRSDVTIKPKKGSSRPISNGRQSVIPLPMFAGERIIDNGRSFRLPFTIFNPLPPGQPKPEEWKKTHKNVFVGDAADLWKKAKRLESSKCVCTPESGCDENCHNRFMLYECDSSNCNIGAECCTNRAFESLRQRTKAGGKYNIGVEVCKTVDRGYGVRSNRTFEPSQIIVEYTGEIITQEECDSRMHGRYKDAECYYLMDFDQQMILDATRGSMARFVNHSCEPNCRMIKWTVSGKPRMALFAGDKGIMTGEELTYDYNFDPYSVKNVQECRCGSANCRGFLGPKPKEIKDALKPITTGKRKFSEIVDEAVRTVTKKRKIAVPKRVNDILAKAKITTNEGLQKAKIAVGSAAGNDRSVKKASEKSLRGWKGWVLLDEEGKEVAEDKKVITYEMERRHSSHATLTKKHLKAETEEPPNTRQPRLSSDVEDTASRTNSTKISKGNVKKNVVRTVRRTFNVGHGKTIKVIGDQED